jgi:hypothetical protein
VADDVARGAGMAAAGGGGGDEVSGGGPRQISERLESCEPIVSLLEGRVTAAAKGRLLSRRKVHQTNPKQPYPSEKPKKEKHKIHKPKSKVK